MKLSNDFPIFAEETTMHWNMTTQAMTQQIAEYFKTQPVVIAWLVGCFARGEQTAESDVDVLVVLDHSQPVGLKFFGMYEDLKELLGRNQKTLKKDSIEIKLAVLF